MGKAATGDPGILGHVGSWHGTAPGGVEQVSDPAFSKAFGQQSADGMDCNTSGNAGIRPGSQGPGTIETSRIGDDRGPIRAPTNTTIADTNVNLMGNRGELPENMELGPASLGGNAMLPVLGQGDTDTHTKGDDPNITVGDGVTPVKKTKMSTFSFDMLDVLGQILEDSNAAIRQTLRDFSDIHLRKVTEFYRPRIQEAIEECVEGVSLEILKEAKWNEDCYRDIQQLVRDRRQQEAAKRLLDTVMESGAQTAREMWENFVKRKDTNPKLRKILQEIESKGASLPMEVSRSLMQPTVSNYLKEIQVQHKTFLHDKNVNQLVKVTGGKKVESTLDQLYTEQIIVLSDRGQSVARLGLTVRGRRREEGRRMVIKSHRESIRIGQLFRSSFGKSSLCGTAVVSGPAGIGKTTMIQKIVHDWADGKIYQQFQFVLPFRFRDLNDIKGRTSVRKLVLNSYPHFGNRIEQLWNEPLGLLFILDSLEEFKEKVDFTNSQTKALTESQCLHPDCECEVADIVRCLIQQKVLKGCSVLVTARSTELESLAEADINLWAEIVGF
ncbi:NACHT, LRR and PYD domains-containing protein 6-like [Scyliorhinus canicula]|uniref:NACHT, LRR and PYD domains-containing protein 6-like n=1 Tax=Scyliorhinus canicula TaxID=7830 RepID=UPI0018F6E0A8|nr:NACHT, LRR and PYD domains-containing protein 6-like [Scyliorhinus canicula]